MEGAADMENLKTAFENDEQKNQMKEYNVFMHSKMHSGIFL